MAEEEKGTSSWFKVPTWSGNPTEWRSFKKEMSWWMASLDSEACKKYNVAARWALRQHGVVRARCEEFDPDELQGAAAEMGLDPESGEEVILVEADPFAGLKKLMKALEESVGKTELDRRGELRAQFYQELRRAPGERISAFCTRFRTLASELKREGIELPKGELGWFLKDRMGLDSIRRQLLETALAGREEYEMVETEALRLFRDLHTADPLRKAAPGVGGPPLLSRFLSSQGGSARTSTPSSGSSQASTFKSFRSGSSVGSFRSQPFRKPFQQHHQPPRQAMVAEGNDEAGDEEELVPAEDDAGAQHGEAPSVEEVLQMEAECLASELQELEDEGVVEPALIEELESGVETAAESLVTMREARTRIAEVRKDRGFGKIGGGKGNKGKKVHGNQATALKSSTTCWDCGEKGHWAGDSQCARPGAGLHKPKGKGGTSGPKQVKITESLNTEHAVELVDQPAAVGGDHEALVCSTEDVTLQEALSMSSKTTSPAPSLSADKKLVGALDSACNRTCTGEVWLKHYLNSLDDAPAAIKDLIRAVPENETFRFGNGGCKTSYVRYRIPMMIGSSLLVVWVSVVDVPSLGLLLGRDFLDAIGAVLSFSRKMLRADLLDGSLVKLRQLTAGHFALRLAPPMWSLPGALRWRKVGQGGVIEIQVASHEWLRRKLEAHCMTTKPEHEHLVTEQGFQAASLCLHGLVENEKMINAGPLHSAHVAQAMCSSSLKASTPTTSPSRRSQLGGRALRDGQRELPATKWLRMCLRMQWRAVWHVRGMLLWLLQRPYLRYAPFPYPSVNTVQQWSLQSDQMVESKALSQRHATRAKKYKVYTMGNLSELAWLRNRIGLRLAFVEDPMVVGMMAARQMKGAAATMKRAVIEDAKAEAKRLEQEGRTQEAIRSMIGPRGGLPTLKADLLRLAALLHVQVHEKLTVDQLRAKCRDVVKDIKMDPKKEKDSGSSSSAALVPASPESPVRKPLMLSPPATPEKAGITMEDLKEMMSQQDQRYQGMLNQVMQTVMNMQQQSLGPQQFFLDPGSQAMPMETSEFTTDEVKDMANQGFTKDEIAQMNADYYQDRMRERAEAQGLDFESLSQREKEDMMNEL